MKLKIGIFLLLFVLLLLNSYSQKENNIWYFGNGAGITFNTSTPAFINNGQLFTDEGCASVSDENGKLLFYTDGITVWNTKHEVMKNGNGLSGNKSSTHSALIVPHPNDINQYYIFTTTEKGEPGGLQYSIVDVAKENKKGVVISKNNLVYTPVSEKLAVTQHANGKDFWIITHKWGTDEFLCFLLKSNGLMKAPIISTVGTTHKDVGSGNKGEAIGQIKVSPNQKKIAVAITYKPNQPIEIFDFDNKTGKLSNLREIPTSGYAYGLEFSPDNTKLYASFLKGSFGVVQYDLEVDDIFESGTTPLSTPKGVENFGSLQLGPDEKIYVAKTGRYVDAITKPNEKGTNCSYKLGAINLKDRSCVYGLPPMVPGRNIDIQPELIIENKNETINNSTQGNLNSNSTLCTEYVELDAGQSNKLYLWSTGEKTQKIIVKEPGVYNVKISDPANINSELQSFTVQSGQPKVDLGKDQKLTCVASLDLDAKNKGYEYKWSTGSKKQTLTVRESGVYSVTVTNGSCFDIDTIKVEFVNKPPNFKALTSFSPSNTSFNSFFDYSITGVTEFELIVKNEKGKTVFKTNNPKDKWNGINKKRELEPVGDYHWNVKYIGPCTGGKYITEEGVVKLY